MELKDLLAFYFERSNAANGLWGFYITVVLGLLAYFGSAPASRQKLVLAAIVSLGFIGFAFVNANAILEVTEARRVTAALILKYQENGRSFGIEDLKATVRVPSISGTTRFHVASDLAVLAGLWVLTLYRR